MTDNHAVVMILMGIVAAILYRFWKQILLALLMVVVTIFCFGIYSFAVSLAS
ncbi:hypothetical protein OHA70_29610 [Kribbella sp. NBC_00382]|uniref:hypothetical protein n=1 Tax=Kribbella sp. NBC_00382 TaxID=2975967 RepID=UPI002E23BE55